MFQKYFDLNRERKHGAHLKLCVKRRVLVSFPPGGILVSSAPHLSEQSHAKRSPNAGIYEPLRVFWIDFKKKSSGKCADLTGGVRVFILLLVYSSRTSVENPPVVIKTSPAHFLSPSVWHTRVSVNLSVEKINLGFFFFVVGTEKRARSHWNQ